MKRACQRALLANVASCDDLPPRLLDKSFPQQLSRARGCAPSYLYIFRCLAAWLCGASMRWYRQSSMPLSPLDVAFESEALICLMLSMCWNYARLIPAPSPLPSFCQTSHCAVFNA